MTSSSSLYQLSLMLELPIVVVVIAALIHIDDIKHSSLLMFVEQPLQNDIPARK